MEAIGGWFADLFRTIFLYLDFVVYWLVDQIYLLFVLIADTGLFNPQTIQDFGSRIYILLAIIMVFIVSFSMIKYIINPDDFLSEKKGVAQLLKNFFIVLIGIVAVPTVFSLAFELQSIVLKDNIIPKIILGSNVDNPTMTVDGEEIDQITFGGKTMAATVFSAFFKPNQKEWEGCNYPDYDGCGDILDATKVLKSKLGDAKDVLEVINAGIVNEKIDPTYADAGDKEEYAIDYTYIVSAIAGGVLIYVLLIFCIDIAIRSVKLGFLQLIAPVPIVSLLDPREKGSGMFSKWVKTVTSTYLGLFIRLIAVYFAIAVIILITAGGAEFYRISDNTPMDNVFVKVFIIFGALLFAKELPKLLEDLTGMKLSGGSMSLKSKFKDVPGVAAAKTVGRAGSRVAAGVGGVGVGLMAAGKNIQETKEWNQKNPDNKRNALSVAGQSLATVGRAGIGGLTGGREGVKDANKISHDKMERSMKAAKAPITNKKGEATGYNAAARNHDRLASATGGQTYAEQFDDAAKDYERSTNIVRDENGNITSMGYTAAQEQLFTAKQELSKYDGLSDADRVQNSAAIMAANEKFLKAEKDAHDATNKLSDMKVKAEKQKKLQDSYKIGAKKETKKKK